MYEGWNVPIDYDPLLAKLIAYGSDRDQAIARLARALDEYFVGGIETNISLFRRILRDADFRAARLDTGFLDRMLRRTEKQPADSRMAEVAAIAAGMFAAFAAGSADAVAGSSGADRTDTKWKGASRREALR
jgi:acetyl-CoA carboxylase biotin carboxylase subunit